MRLSPSSSLRPRADLALPLSLPPHPPRHDDIFSRHDPHHHADLFTCARRTFLLSRAGLNLAFEIFCSTTSRVRVNLLCSSPSTARID